MASSIHRGADRRASIAERLSWCAGLVAIGAWVLIAAAGTAGARADRERFDALHSSQLETVEPDLSLWSPERIRAWRDTLKTRGAAPLGIFRVPRLKIDVVVLDGTDDWALNRGVGLIEETAKPGTDGNIGIAGHRDGFFRGLKDVSAGDVFELETPTRTDRYRVERTWIVTPEDVSVLDPTPTPSITLVTCYPFYFIVPAPQRFIVRAVRFDSSTTKHPPIG
jgi:sortase A